MRFVKVLGWVLLAVLPHMAQADEGWAGAHAQLELSLVSGSNAMQLDIEKYGSVDLWQMPLQSDTPALGAAVGYRLQLGQSPLLLGVEASLRKGGVSGLLSWQAEPYDVGASLSYEAEYQATLGLQLGYALNSHWLVYGEWGMAGADATLAAEAHAWQYAAAASESGYLMGQYQSIGIVYQLDSGVTFGLEYLRTDYEASKDYDYGLGLTAGTRTEGLAVSIGIQF